MAGWELLHEALGWALGGGALLAFGTVRGLPDDGMETDLEMVEAVRAGDATAYRGLVEKYQQRVYQVVYGVVRDREDAAEITQEVFIKAYRNLSGFRGDARFYTWIYRIAMNLAIDHCRKNRRRRTSSFDEAIAARDEDGTVLELHHSESPHKSLSRKELQEKIYKALDELSEEQREVVLLREVEGLSYKEIADAMEIPEGTVMSRLFYARKRLQMLLKDEEAR